MQASAHLEQLAPKGDAEIPPIDAEIPPIIEQVPTIPTPKPAQEVQTFTVMAINRPIGEILLGLARDAGLNLVVDPALTSKVSMNAIDLPLAQILRQISRQLSLRYHLDGSDLVVEKDAPFLRNYQIDYLNISRTTASTIDVSSNISGSSAGSGGVGSSTQLQNKAQNDFWKTLEDNIALLATNGDTQGSVISNREAGTISVRATSAVHDDIERFIEQVLKTAQRQVLIEATVVEVTLSDAFETGVDWSKIANGNGWSIQQNVLGGALNTAPFVSATYADNNDSRNISAVIRALDSFGDVSVMSSPKVMALNNQTSILKVVDNRVYFSTEVQREPATDNSPPYTLVTTTIHTVPVGFVMSVTPYITDTDEVILNIRPTISRILQFIDVPNPALADAGVRSTVPEIQVREIESVLRVADGNTAVIGGLMQNSANQSSSGLPGAHDDGILGFLFGRKTNKLEKTELVIFLRPRIISDADVDTSLQDFKRFLKPSAFTEQANE